MHILQTIRYFTYWYLIVSKAFQLFTKKTTSSSIEVNKDNNFELCLHELNHNCLFKSSNIDEEEWGQFIFIDE